MWFVVREELLHPYSEEKQIWSVMAVDQYWYINFP